MSSKVLDRKNKKVTLYKDHLKNSVIARLRSGYMTMYDIKIGDPSKEDYGDFTKSEYIPRVLSEAERLGYPVLLQMDNTIRLLIFNRSL